MTKNNQNFKKFLVSKITGEIPEEPWKEVWFSKVKHNQCIVCRSEPEEGKMCDRYIADIKKNLGRCKNFN